MGCISSKNAGVDPVRTKPTTTTTTETTTTKPVTNNVAPVVRAKVQVTERDKAMLDLKHQRDLLNQLKKRTEASRDRETKVAMRLMKEGKKDRAIVVLRRRKLLEKQTRNADGKLEKVEELVMAMESSEMQKSVLESIESGTSALKKLQETMKLEDVEKLLEENREAIEYQEEVSAMLGQDLRPGDVPDDEALEAELNGYLEKEKKEEESKTEDAVGGDATVLPSVPADVNPGPVPEKVGEDEEEIVVDEDGENDHVITEKKRVTEATPA